MRDTAAAIVVDTGVPGAEVAWQLHAMLASPVVALARDVNPSAAAALLDRGASDVLTGAVDDQVLSATVAAVLRRRRADLTDAGQPAVVRLGQTTVDLAERSVRWPGGAAASLSRTEFALFRAPSLKRRDAPAGRTN